MDFWRLMVLQTPLGLAQYDNCVGVKSLVVILVAGDGNNEKLSKAVIYTAYLSYLDYLNDTQAPIVWTGKPLKTEIITHDVEGLSYLSYYKLESAKQQQPTN